MVGSLTPELRTRPSGELKPWRTVVRPGPSTPPIERKFVRPEIASAVGVELRGSPEGIVRSYAAIDMPTGVVIVAAERNLAGRSDMPTSLS
jgi:hypothetical protein